jgi:hypothetical protein
MANMRSSCLIEPGCIVTQFKMNFMNSLFFEKSNLEAFQLYALFFLSAMTFTSVGPKGPWPSEDRKLAYV